jgi:hypothetical protein
VGQTAPKRGLGAPSRVCLPSFAPIVYCRDPDATLSPEVLPIAARPTIGPVEVCFNNPSSFAAAVADVRFQEPQRLEGHDQWGDDEVRL